MNQAKRNTRIALRMGAIALCVLFGACIDPAQSRERLNEKPNESTISLGKDSRFLQSVSQNWKYSGNSPVDLLITFKVSRSGGVYDLTLLNGLENPLAVKAATHALLFAAPFKEATPKKGLKRKYYLRINGTGIKTSISIHHKEVIESVDIEKTIQSLKFEDALPRTIVRGLRDKQLSAFCEMLYVDPDSKLLKDKLINVFNQIGLSETDSQSWKCLSESRHFSYRNGSNQSNLSSSELKASIGPMFQSWQIDQSPSTLFQLEKLYCAKFAIDVSKKTPRTMASIGEKLLQQRYSQAIQECNNLSKTGNRTAKILLSDIRNEGLDDRPTGPEKIQGGSTENFNPIQPRNWLPADAELLVFEKAPFSNTQISRLVRFDRGQADLGVQSTDYKKIQNNNSTFYIGDVSCFIHAARNFNRANYPGIGGSESLDFIVFKTNNNAKLTTLINKLKNSSACQLRIANEDVYVFSNAPFSFGRFIASLRNDRPTYLCRLGDVALISSNSIEFLRDYIGSIHKSGFLTTKSEIAPPKEENVIWGYRKYDPHCLPFSSSTVAGKGNLSRNGELSIPISEELGFGFYLKQDELIVRCFSKSREILNVLKGKWRIVFKESSEDAITDESVTCKGNPNKNTITEFVLLDSLGYGAAI